MKQKKLWVMAAILYMFYLSKEGEALAVQHPEMPLEQLYL